MDRVTREQVEEMIQQALEPQMKQLEEMMQQLTGWCSKLQQAHMSQAQSQAGPSQPRRVQAPQGQSVKTLAKQVERLQARLRSEGFKDFVDLDDSIANAEEGLPKKFKMPDLVKFDGTSDPRAHLKQYAAIMSAAGLTHAQITRMFALSLSGSAPLRWYHGLDKSVQQDWRKLSEEFVREYSYNMELAVTLHDLEITRQRPNETFSDYLRRWRKKASLMRNKPSEKDQIRIMLKGALPSIRERLCFIPLQTIEELHESGIQAEEAGRWNKREPFKSSINQYPEDESLPEHVVSDEESFLDFF